MVEAYVVGILKEHRSEGDKFPKMLLHGTLEKSQSIYHKDFSPRCEISGAYRILNATRQDTLNMSTL